MRRKISLLMTLAAWLLATGSHWDVVQTFAWARMITSYAQTMPLAQAVQLTFSGDDLCGVCEVVQDAKQQEKAAVPGGRVDDKILLVFQPASNAVIAAPALTSWSQSDSILSSSEPVSPPVPPPRSAAA